MARNLFVLTLIFVAVVSVAMAAEAPSSSPKSSPSTSSSPKTSTPETSSPKSSPATPTSSETPAASPSDNEEDLNLNAPASSPSDGEIPEDQEPAVADDESTSGASSLKVSAVAVVVAAGFFAF